MTLGELAAALGGELRGPAGQHVSGPVAADSNDPAGIAFAESREYLESALASNVGALLLSASLAEGIAKPCIVVSDVRQSFRRLLQIFDSPLPLDERVHPTAAVHSTASVSDTARIGAYAVVEAGASIGDRARIYAHAYIGEHCLIEEDAVVYPHAVLYRTVRVGARSVIHAGAVIGADGFGYRWDGTARVKVPQVGSVSIGDDVEIGALTTIDRAAVGETRIGDGTKIDNLVQVGHNARIGSHGAIAAQTGVSGSARLGDRVVLGGQTGVADHVRVCDDSMFAARTAVLQDIEEPGTYMGTPARPIEQARKAMMLVMKLPELVTRLRKLERRKDRNE